MFGINGYNPVFYGDRNDLIINNRDFLESLVGQTLEKVYWVWDNKSDEWFRDCPVAIKLSKGLCTLCANRDSDFSIGWNNIDFKKHIDWYGIYDFNLEWRSYQTEEIGRIIGKKIISIEVINYLHNQRILYSKDDKSCIGKEFQVDLLHGIGFRFINCIFAVTNGLDDNNIEIMEHDFDAHLTKITIY